VILTLILTADDHVRRPLGQRRYQPAERFSGGERARQPCKDETGSVDRPCAGADGMHAPRQIMVERRLGRLRTARVAGAQNEEGPAFTDVHGVPFLPAATVPGAQAAALLPQ